jgi:hypothetical protein
MLLRGKTFNPHKIVERDRRLGRSQGRWSAASQNRKRRIDVLCRLKSESLNFRRASLIAGVAVRLGAQKIGADGWIFTNNLPVRYGMLS